MIDEINRIVCQTYVIPVEQAKKDQTEAALAFSEVLERALLPWLDAAIETLNNLYERIKLDESKV